MQAQTTKIDDQFGVLNTRTADLVIALRQNILELLNEIHPHDPFAIQKHYRVMLIKQAPAGLYTLATLRRFQMTRLNEANDKEQMLYMFMPERVFSKLPLMSDIEAAQARDKARKALKHKFAEIYAMPQKQGQAALRLLHDQFRKWKSSSAQRANMDSSAEAHDSAETDEINDTVNEHYTQVLSEEPQIVSQVVVNDRDARAFASAKVRSEIKSFRLAKQNASDSHKGKRGSTTVLRINGAPVLKPIIMTKGVEYDAHALYDSLVRFSNQDDTYF